MNEAPQIMDAAAVAAIGALVTALAQVVKRSWPGDIDTYGPLIAAVLAALGVGLWVLSSPTFPPARTDLWVIGAGWVAVFTSAVGIYESVKMMTATAPRNRSRRVVPAPPPAPATDDLPPEPASLPPALRTRPRPAPSEDLG